MRNKTHLRKFIRTLLAYLVLEKSSSTDDVVKYVLAHVSIDCTKWVIQHVDVSVLVDGSRQ